MHGEVSEPCHQHETLDGDKRLSVLHLGWTRSTGSVSQNSNVDGDKLLGMFDPGRKALEACCNPETLDSEKLLGVMT